MVSWNMGTLTSKGMLPLLTTLQRFRTAFSGALTTVLSAHRHLLLGVTSGRMLIIFLFRILALWLPLPATS